MASALKLWQRILNSPTNVRFADLCRVAESFGFTLQRVNGSHHIYHCPGVTELLNLQELRGQAKPYQVRQLIRLVEEYNLSLEGEGDAE